LQTVIGVRFKKAGKMYYFDPGNLEIKKEDQVVVETSRGVECGLVVAGPKEIDEESISSPLKVVRRLATEEDRNQIAENARREKEAFDICVQKILSHKLPMKLVDVEYTFDMNKIIFYFTADGRIDFRELVKDLASVFRTRIELRQIGVRDEAKLMGGIGCCGRPLCCATFLGDFEPVSIRMAKDQNLSLNPTKISGICGRLMCCLKYENDYYERNYPRNQQVVQAPERGSRIVSDEGEGKIVAVNEQRRTATILLDNGRTIVEPWENVVEKDEMDEGARAEEKNFADVGESFEDDEMSRALQAYEAGSCAEGYAEREERRKNRRPRQRDGARRDREERRGADRFERGHRRNGDRREESSRGSRNERGARRDHGRNERHDRGSRMHRNTENGGASNRMESKEHAAGNGEKRPDA